MASAKKSKKAHVTFGDSKRILSYEKGEDVQGLRLHFLRVFSDVLSDDVAPANVKFQRYDESFKDYVDLGNDTKLEEGAKIKATTVSTHGKKHLQVGDHCTESTGADQSSHVHHHVTIPMYKLDEATAPDIKFHLIKKDVPYRFWSPVSNGLVETDVTNPKKVTSSGSFDSGNSVNTLIQAKPPAKKNNLGFHFVFNGDGPQKDYLYMTAQGEGKDIVVTKTPTADSVFEPDYYWGHTMFKSGDSSTSLYLGSDRDGKATLVRMKDPRYPNPQALFIVNKYE